MTIARKKNRFRPAVDPCEAICLMAANSLVGALADHGQAAVAPLSSPVTAKAIRTVESTAYCLRGTMANGRRTHDGAVAMNGVPFGTRFRILSGPLRGKIVTVEDRIGSGSQFDIWMSSCSAARQYGRRTIRIEQLGR